MHKGRIPRTAIERNVMSILAVPAHLLPVDSTARNYLLSRAFEGQDVECYEPVQTGIPKAERYWFVIIDNKRCDIRELVERMEEVPAIDTGPLPIVRRNQK